eukprot:jgi/Tetstr1/453427/TSEL_040409.t1
MERPNFAVDEVGGLALTYGNAQSEGNAFPRMLAVAGAALDIDMDTPHTNETYTDEEDNGATPHGNAGARHPNRAGNEKRDRDQALRRLSQYSDGVFRRRFKLTRKRFWSLLDVLRPDLELDDLGQRKARNSSGSPVPPECKLAVTLRWLAGSNFADAEDLYGVGTTTVYSTCIWPVVEAINNRCKTPFRPFNQEDLQRLADEMTQRSGNTLPGCIGALDGMAVHIGQPNAKKVKNVKHYRNRKKFFSINLQAVADAHRRIIYYDLSTAGSTHDSLAWKMSPLGRALDGKGLPDGSWIAGDDAYVCSDYLITPHSTSAIRRAGKDGVYLDNFNFYQSRIRINIECAFGLLVAKFGILRRAMTGTMEHNTAVVNACIHLHNMGVDDNMPFSAPLSRDIMIGDRLKPLRQDQVTVAPRSMRKHPKTSMRDRLTQHLRDLARARPTYQRQTRGVAKK